MGYLMRQLLATICVALSLTLVALDNSDPSNGFLLRSLSFIMIPTIEGPIGDTTYVSLVGTVGAICEE
jgi:hypothetical protein